MMKRNTRRANSATAATALIVSGAVLLTIAPIGHVVVSGQRPTEIVDQAVSESGSPSASKRNEGRRLFRKETFGGNGRTCETCHSRGTGTLSPDDVQRLLEQEPSNPLFLHDGLDDGVSGTSRIAEHATIRMVLPLPPNIRIAEDPSATSVVLLR